MLTMSAAFLSRLDAHDRALFTRWALEATASRAARRFWKMLTHLGGTTCSIAAALLPSFGAGPLGVAGRKALLTLAASHLLVQLVKRTVGRPRPSRDTDCVTLVQEPDRFSFPSGHSAAAMSVAFVYAMLFPSMAVPLLVAAMLVGMSRVFLAVHYPGDVLVGQLLAVLTGAVVLVR